MDLQYFVDRLPGKPNRDTIASQIENSSTPITTDQALNAWYEHDALHYLANQPFTDEGEEFVAYLEKQFNRGWLPFGEKYNTYYQRKCMFSHITQELITETAEQIGDLLDMTYTPLWHKVKDFPSGHIFNFIKQGVTEEEANDVGMTWEDAIAIEPHWTMAHIAVAMGLFPSVGQAKKNNWNEPIEVGYSEKGPISKKKLLCYFIWNPPDEFLNV